MSASAFQKALDGGIPGAAAMAVQVSTLMWLRTLVNYQYRYGTSMTQAFQTLYRDGGIRRFYRGYTAAMVQAPLSRFGDTAANAGVLAWFQQSPTYQTTPVAIQTAVASTTAAGFRILLMPLDTLKTTLQVEGTNARALLRNKIRHQGIQSLYHGSLAASAATFVGHYPWFATYNYLQARLPRPPPSDSHARLLRNAFIGFLSAAVSDVCSNALRVIKTTRQTSVAAIATTSSATSVAIAPSSANSNNATLSYPDIVRSIVEKEGLKGLFGRGLKTKLLTNGVQGMLFSVCWNLGQDLDKKAKETK